MSMEMAKSMWMPRPLKDLENCSVNWVGAKFLVSRWLNLIGNFQCCPSTTTTADSGVVAPLAPNFPPLSSKQMKWRWRCLLGVSVCGTATGANWSSQPATGNKPKKSILPQAPLLRPPLAFLHFSPCFSHFSAPQICHDKQQQQRQLKPRLRARIADSISGYTAIRLYGYMSPQSKGNGGGTTVLRGWHKHEINMRNT